MSVPTTAGGGTTISGTPTTLVEMRAPGGRFTATGSCGTGRVRPVGKFSPTVLFTPTGPDGKVDAGKPPAPAAVVPLLGKVGVGNELAGGNRNVGWLPAGSITASDGGPAIVDRSNVRPAVWGGWAVIPPGLIGPTGTAVPGVPTGAGVVGTGAVIAPGIVGLCPASTPDGLTAPEPATPALRAPAAALLAPAGEPAAAPPAATCAQTAIGRTADIAKVPKIAFMKKTRPAQPPVNSGETLKKPHPPAD
jgi:hypothetical protein